MLPALAACATNPNLASRPALPLPAAQIAGPVASPEPPIRPPLAAKVSGTVLDEGELHRYFGSFSFELGPDGTVIPDPRWVHAAIADWRVPVLGAVRCHRNVLPQLYYAMREIEQRGLASLIHSYDGCYVPRFQRLDGDVLSAHAYGIAIDLNASRSPQGTTPAIDSRVVSIMERWGFAWGGRFEVPDGMHFEFAGFPRD